MQRSAMLVIVLIAKSVEDVIFVLEFPSIECPTEKRGRMQKGCMKGIRWCRCRYRCYWWCRFFVLVDGIARCAQPGIRLKQQKQVVGDNNHQSTKFAKIYFIECLNSSYALKGCFLDGIAGEIVRKLSYLEMSKSSCRAWSSDSWSEALR